MIGCPLERLGTTLAVAQSLVVMRVAPEGYVVTTSSERRLGANGEMIVLEATGATLREAFARLADVLDDDMRAVA